MLAILASLDTYLALNAYLYLPATMLIRSLAFGRRVLIGYLFEVVGVKFCNLSLHDGIVESQILAFMDEKVVEKGEAQLFLDEIHTCNHIGPHTKFSRKPIHSNVRSVAGRSACILIDCV